MQGWQTWSSIVTKSAGCGALRGARGGRVRMNVEKAGAAAAGLLFLGTLTGCAINPVTGQPSFVSFPFNAAHSIESGFTNIYDSPDPCSNNDRNIGITAGVILGAVVAHEIGSNRVGDLIGAAVGGGIGGLIGHGIDARRCRLYKIAKKNGLKLVSATITPAKLGQGPKVKGAKSLIGLDVQIQNQGLHGDEFVPGTATLTPQARAAFAAVAQQYVPAVMVASAGKKATSQMRVAAAQRKVLIVGHTDQTQYTSRGAQLSAARARAVALVFARAGVPVDNIYYQGAGGTLPIASNASAQGREENRRVQIVDVPSTGDLKRYLQDRSADPADFSVGKALPAASLRRPHRSPVPQAPAAPHVVPVRARTLRSTTPLLYNFGGAPVAARNQYIDLGVPVSHSMFHLIRSAQAAEPVLIRSCTADEPRAATPVRDLGTGQDLPVGQALPGFYGAPWVGMVHGNLVAILHPYVPSAVGAPVPSPDVQIYRDYGSLHERAPSFSRYVPVDVYRGSKAIVYRVFVNGPMRCMDLVDPIKAAVSAGNLYYANAGVEYVARSSFQLRQ